MILQQIEIEHNHPGWFILSCFRSDMKPVCDLKLPSPGTVKYQNIRGLATKGHSRHQALKCHSKYDVLLNEYVVLHIFSCLFVYCPVEQLPTITAQSPSSLIAFPFDENFPMTCEAKGNPEPE